MTTKPLDWTTWLEARRLMGEIWDGWLMYSDHGDAAFVASLQRDKVSYRGKAYAPDIYRTPISLRAVVAGLLSLRLGLSFAIQAEYETTEWQSVLRLDGSRREPVTVRKTAWLDRVELAWSQLRDDLIRYELPAGVRPKGPGQPSDQAPGQSAGDAFAAHDQTPQEPPARASSHPQSQTAENPAVPTAKRRRGRNPQKLNATITAMRADLQSGHLTPEALRDKIEKALAEDYKVSRYTARKARTEVLNNPCSEKKSP